MWPFKGKKSNQSPIAKQSASTEPEVPKEVKEYYQAERRERVGVAWLLALATLITTVLVAFGLFFGGRWAYNKVAKHTPPVKVAIKETPSKPAAPAKPSTPTPNNSGSSKSTPPAQPGKVNAPANPPKSTTTPPASQPSSSAPVKEDVSGDEDNTDESTPSTSPAPAPSPSTNTQTKPSTSPSAPTNGKPLTNTGPGDTISLFVAVSLTAAVGHYLVTKRRLIREN